MPICILLFLLIHHVLVLVFFPVNRLWVSDPADSKTLEMVTSSPACENDGQGDVKRDSIPDNSINQGTLGNGYFHLPSEAIAAKSRFIRSMRTLGFENAFVNHCHKRASKGFLRS